EERSQGGIGAHRLVNLLEKASPLLPPLWISREKLLKLVEHKDAGQRFVIGAHLSRPVFQDAFQSGFEQTVLFISRVRRRPCQSHVQNVNVADIVRECAVPSELRHARRRKHVEAPFLKQGNEAGVKQRSLPGTRLRVKQYGAVRGNQRVQLRSLTVAAEKPVGICLRERPRADVRVCALPCFTGGGCGLQRNVLQRSRSSLANWAAVPQ